MKLRSLKRLNLPCHTLWKANHLPYSTVLRIDIEICDPCHASNFIGVWHSKTTMPVSPMTLPWPISASSFVCFRKQLISTGSGVSFDRFVASVGCWEEIEVVLDSAHFGRLWFGHSLISFWRQHPKIKTRLKRQFLFRRQAFGNPCPSHLAPWWPPVFEKNQCIDSILTNHISCTIQLYIHSTPSHQSAPFQGPASTYLARPQRGLSFRRSNPGSSPGAAETTNSCHRNWCWIPGQAAKSKKNTPFNYRFL